MPKKPAPYLELIADGSVPKLETTGHDLHHDVVQPVNPNPSPPVRLQLSARRCERDDGGLCEHLAGAGGCMLQTCAGNPSV